MGRPVEGDFAGDVAAGLPSVDTGSSGPSGAGTFGQDTGDPSQPPTGICPENEPGCGICDPIGCTCDPTFDPSYCNFWPKVGFARYLALTNLLNNLNQQGRLDACTLSAIGVFWKCVAISIGVGQEPEACTFGCLGTGPAWPECVTTCLGIVEILEAVKVGLRLVAAIATYEHCKSQPTQVAALPAAEDPRGCALAGGTGTVRGP